MLCVASDVYVSLDGNVHIGLMRAAIIFSVEAPSVAADLILTCAFES